MRRMEAMRTSLPRPRLVHQLPFVQSTPLPNHRNAARSRLFSSTVRPRHASFQVACTKVPLMLSNRPFVSRIASGALRLLIQSMCTVSDDLQVDIRASSNLALLSGKLNGVSVRASRIEYDGLAISGGAAFYTDEISITTRFQRSIIVGVPRLTKPFSVSVRATLTNSDLNRSGPIRNAIETLLRQIIATSLSGAVGRHLPADIGGVTCILDRVDLSDGDEDTSINVFGFPIKSAANREGKIILRAHATLSSGTTFFFAVRAGLATADDGRVLRLRDPELIWRNITLPLVTVDMIGIKFDVMTKLTNVRIQKSGVSGDGIVVISPPSDRKTLLRIPVSRNDFGRTKQRTNNDGTRL